jgi:uncharacterized protein (TIGR02147 family)
MKSIYAYSDFKVLIRDFLEARRLNGHELTYEELGKRVGFSSKGFMTQIIKGRSKIPIKKIRAFGEALGFKKKEQDYFEILVRYNQAKTNKQKNVLFRKLTERFKTKIKHMGPDTYAFYTTWYYSAIRSILSYYPFSGDYKKLASELVPAITPAQAKKAIGLLEKLSLIGKCDDGFYRVTDRLITTGDTVDAFAVVNYQKSTMDLAKDSLDRFGKPDRSSSTLTLGLSEAGYQAIKEKLDVARREIMEIANYDRQIDRVIQINMHAFPLTKKHKGSL